VGVGGAFAIFCGLGSFGIGVGLRLLLALEEGIADICGRDVVGLGSCQTIAS